MGVEGLPLDLSPKRKGLLQWIFNRRNVVGAVVGTGGAAALGLGFFPAGVVGFFTVRYLYSKAEQQVPFTNRVHVILMPSVAESALGATLYEQFLSEQSKKRTLLEANHPDTELVSSVAKRLVRVLSEGHGGGYQRHLRNFQWQASVVKEPTLNAFVYPGGKIVVYTGLLDLLHRDKDLLAMVMGHEIAHALARHNTEKMGLGFAITIGFHMLAVALGAGDQQRQQHLKQQQQYEHERQQRGYHRSYSRLVHPSAADSDEDTAPLTSSSGTGVTGGSTGSNTGRNYYTSSAAPGRGQGYKGGKYYPPVPPPGGDPPPALPPWMSEEMLKTLSGLVLELPFSRRAETEADLIGLKLMALAGFNPQKGPDAFRLLAEASGGGGRGHGGPTPDALIASLGCTHPDSTHRAQLLSQELEWMARNRDKAHEAVGSKVSYWGV